MCGPCRCPVGYDMGVDHGTMSSQGVSDVHDFGTYHILVRGAVEGEVLNAGSPLQMTIVEHDTVATRLTVFTDQSGLIGVMRHLHGMGFVLLSVQRET